MSYRTSPRLAGWSDDARRAVTEAPDYFVRWYTVKSLGLCAAVAVAAYYLGKDVARGVRRNRGTFRVEK